MELKHFIMQDHETKNYLVLSPQKLHLHLSTQISMYANDFFPDADNWVLGSAIEAPNNPTQTKQFRLDGKRICNLCMSTYLG
jgi:hypothetical protein